MGNYFCGWYHKCQSDTQTLAVIPAIHKTEQSAACSLQLITDTASWNIPFPYADFRREKSAVELGNNRFGKDGIHLDVQVPGLTAAGTLHYGSLTPIRYDIMGPFRYVPCMECRHSVYSMRHRVNGEIRINDTMYTFRDGVGYLEGDRGRSFPQEYVWTQCSFADGSLMLSVADIPLGRYHFTGIIGVILWQGKEYRLATYLGAKAVTIRGGEIAVQQGKLRLTVRQLEQAGHKLLAPTGAPWCEPSTNTPPAAHTTASRTTDKPCLSWNLPTPLLSMSIRIKSVALH